MYIPYKLADRSIALVEMTDEVAAFILEDDRLTRNAERRERDHAPYHIEAMKYEGDSLAYHETPEDIVIRKEEQQELKERVGSAMSHLTDAQFRRILMKAEGMTVREIAEAEGTSINAIEECLEAAKKKFKKYF